MPGAMPPVFRSLVGGHARDAEIRELDHAVGAHENVARLDVAMDDAEAGAMAASAPSSCEK